MGKSQEEDIYVKFSIVGNFEKIVYKRRAQKSMNHHQTTPTAHRKKSDYYSYYKMKRIIRYNNFTGVQKMMLQVYLLFLFVYNLFSFSFAILYLPINFIIISETCSFLDMKCTYQ